ncbi:MAG: DUF4097 family beta strand repeat protein [Clostridia bacterium]|nr:DUF4097 family beta strand repeat protein [Clostridia bacterium]
MNFNLRRFTRIAVVVLFIVVILICIVLRFAIDTALNFIRGSVDTVSSVISVSASGVNIADAIVVDEEGVRVGDIRVDFAEVGKQVSDGLEVAGITVEEGMAGKLDAIDASGSGFTQNRYTFDPAINRALDIDVTGCDIVIAAGDSETITVDVLECEDFRYSFATSDNTLVIRDAAAQPAQKVLNILGFKLNLGAVEKTNTYTGLAMIIYLPESFSGEIGLRTSDGDVKLGNLTLDEKLTVTTSAGNVELAGIDAYDIAVSTSGGRLKLDRLSATEITASTTDERVSLSELVAKRLTVTTTNASIDFTRLFGEKFIFRTNGGDIDCSILGEESLFTIKTVTDRSAYPKSVENARAQYSLEASTSGGDIDVRFVEG